MRIRGSRLLKSLDRIVGVPTVGLLGLTPKNRQPDTVRKVGVLRTAALGDTLLLAGPLTDLRQALPDADIVLITGEQNAEAGALVVRGRARSAVISVVRPFDAIQRLRRERFDVLIDTGAWPRIDAILTALSAARFRIGFQSPGQSRHFAYDVTVTHSSSVHEIDNFRALVGAVGARGCSAPSIMMPTTDASWNTLVPASSSIVFHPWSGGYRGWIKEWPAQRWIELGVGLKDRASTVAVSGGPSDVDRAVALVNDMRAAGIPAVSLAGKLSLEQLAHLLREALAVVSVNTGVMHLAAMLNTPTVSLDGPSPAHRWGPVGPRAGSVTSTLSGCGFLNHGFEYRGKRQDCMLGISVDSVMEAVQALLKPQGVARQVS